MDPLGQLMATFQLIVAKNKTLQLDQLSALILNSIKYFDFSQNIESSIIERLCNLWSILLDAEIHLSPDLLLPLSKEPPSFKSKLLQGENIVMHAAAFDILFKLTTRFFSETSTKITEKNPGTSTKPLQFKHSPFIRTKFIILWKKLITKVAFVVIKHPESSENRVMLFSVKNYLSQQSKINILAYAICGFLDNITSIDDHDISYHALNTLSTLLESTTHHNIIKSELTNKNLENPPIQNSNSVGILTEAHILSQFFPGIFSTLLKISLSDLDFALTSSHSDFPLVYKKLKVKDKTRYMCLSVLRSAINICCSDKNFESLNTFDNSASKDSNIITIPTSWANLSSNIILNQINFNDNSLPLISNQNLENNTIDRITTEADKAFSQSIQTDEISENANTTLDLLHNTIFYLGLVNFWIIFRNQ
ncbi:hypothetical protein BB561_004205 [Smittium simulii]|uniref:Uncharacterized protein n=1 Tax=Smittium simulii TaxID=133385 RepID=A0A2T9YHG4_9FUNG|nr:hypothetical protein BB561_004205 [Smittium simulii]